MHAAFAHLSIPIPQRPMHPVRATVTSNPSTWSCAHWSADQPWTKSVRLTLWSPTDSDWAPSQPAEIALVFLLGSREYRSGAISSLVSQPLSMGQNSWSGKSLTRTPAHFSRRRLPANLARDYCGSHECSRNDDSTMGDTLREVSKLLYFPWNLVAHATRLHRPIRPSSKNIQRPRGSLRYRMTGELLPRDKGQNDDLQRYGLWCDSCQVESVYALQKKDPLHWKRQGHLSSAYRPAIVDGTMILSTTTSHDESCMGMRLFWRCERPRLRHKHQPMPPFFCYNGWCVGFWAVSNPPSVCPAEVRRAGASRLATQSASVSLDTRNSGRLLFEFQSGSFVHIRQGLLVKRPARFNLPIFISRL